MADQSGPYYERIGGRSPSTVGFSRRGGGRAVMKQLIGDEGSGDNELTLGTEVHDAIKEILGFTVMHEDGIRLHRTLPRAFPLCPWLYADSISELTGLGRMSIVDTDPGLEASSFDQAAFYPTQEITIEFKPVPYAVLADDSIETGTIATWTKPNGTTETDVDYAKEWLRYTDIERLPAGEYIVAQSGQFLFDVASGQAPNGQPAGNGQLRMFWKKPTLKVQWFEVPYEYVDFINSSGTRTDSYIEQALGCVNQNAFLGYGVGELVLNGVGIFRYPQIVPDYRYWQDSTAFTPRKLCDITFLFQISNPPLGKDAAGNAATPSGGANANVVTAGWNRVPYAHMAGWYFAKTSVTGFADASGRGIYPSFPMELCFTNPGISVT